MGTTRIKVIDLSSDQQQVKTSRKHAEKLAGVGKLKKAEKPKTHKKPATVEAAQEVGETKVEPKVEEEEKEAVSQAPETVEKATVAKRQSLYHKGKRYKDARKMVEDKTYTAKEAFELLPKTAITTFDSSVEVHLNVTDQKIRGSLNLPHAKLERKKEKKYLVFGDLSSEALAKGDKHVIWGNDATIVDIENGKLKPGRDFDAVVASPKFMPLLARIAKILGPKGMMPNPKDGTITEDFQKVIEGSQSATHEFKTDPQAPIVHFKIGKVSQKPDELSENLKVLITAISPSKITKATLTSTMGPPIRFDVNTL